MRLEEADRDEEIYSAVNLSCLRNTAIGNILDLCGLSVPCGFTDSGLPIGLMIYAKPFDEATVLRVGHAFQQATDWHRQTPDLGWATDYPNLADSSPVSAILRASRYVSDCST